MSGCSSCLPTISSTAAMQRTCRTIIVRSHISHKGRKHNDDLRWAPRRCQLTLPNVNATALLCAMKWRWLPNSYLMPQECCPLDMKSIQSSPISTSWLHLIHLKSQHGPPEAFHMLQVHLAEVPEIMLANKMCSRLLHGCNVELTMLRNEVCVFSMCCAEPTPQHIRTSASGQGRAGQGTTGWERILYRWKCCCHSAYCWPQPCCLGVGACLLADVNTHMLLTIHWC